MKSHGSASSNLKQNCLAQGLGWFSVALGAAELILPGGLASLVGVRKRNLLFRMIGLRELASGIGILTRPKSAPWLWTRVAGDALDLALLGTALAAPGAKKGRVVAAAAAVVGVTVLDVMASQKQSRNGQAGAPPRERGLHVKKTIIIDRSPQELYHYWRNFENLPRFMYHLDSVQVASPTRSHWVAKAPAGTRVEWDAEVTEDRPNEMIAWRSLEGADVESSGSVRFSQAPGNRGTMVAVEMRYQPPGGVLGAAMAKLFHKEPKQAIEDSLRFFKQLMETGSVLTIKGQPAGRAKSTSKKFDYKVPHVPSREFAHS